MDKCCCEVTTADAGDDQTVCGEAALAANSPTSGCGKWSVVSGGGTFKNPKKYNTTVTNLNDGANVFRWTIKNCGCPCLESSTDDVTITNSCV